jgi:hypothetical protein
VFYWGKGRGDRTVEQAHIEFAQQLCSCPKLASVAEKAKLLILTISVHLAEESIKQPQSACEDTIFRMLL